jgi:hypothetical protein
MPTITATHVDVDVDIDVEDFLTECSSGEINDLINVLAKDGHLSSKQAIKASSKGLSILEEEFFNKCTELALKFYSMSDQEIELIENLHKKYC